MAMIRYVILMRTQLGCLWLFDKRSPPADSEGCGPTSASHVHSLSGHTLVSSMGGFQHHRRPSHPRNPALTAWKVVLINAQKASFDGNRLDASASPLRTDPRKKGNWQAWAGVEETHLIP